MKAAQSEVAWKILANINAWIKFSDSKAAALVTANGIIIGFLALVSDDATLWAKAVALLAIALAAVSVVHAVLCLKPTLEVGESNSIIFYGHIAKRLHPAATSIEAERARVNFDSDFSQVLDGEETLVKELADQVWANSHVAWKKYRNVAISVRWLFGALIAGVILAAVTVIH